MVNFDEDFTADGRVPNSLDDVNPRQLQAPTLLPANYEPRRNDICCGRGKRNWNHQGNIWFRTLIQGTLDRYIEAPSKTDKTAVVMSVVEQVRAEGSFFVKQNDRGQWYDIGNPSAREKVGHSLRDQVTAMKKEAKKQTTTAAPMLQPLASGLSSAMPAPARSSAVASGVTSTVSSTGATDPASLYGYNDFSTPNDALQPTPLMPNHHQQQQRQQQQHLTANGDAQNTSNVMSSFPLPLRQNPVQRYSSEPTTKHHHMGPPQAMHPHQQQQSMPQHLSSQSRQQQQQHLMPNSTEQEEEHQRHESHEVLERFGRRPSWRAMSINSVSAKQMVHDMNQLRELETEIAGCSVADDDDDEFDQEIKQIAFSVGGSSTSSRRRSSLMRFSMTSSTFEDRRLSAMSIGTVPLNGSFTDIQGNYNNVFRSSIRRSSVAWMSEMQQHLLDHDMATFLDQEDTSSGGGETGPPPNPPRQQQQQQQQQQNTNSSNNRRVSAYMLRVMDDNELGR